MKSRADIYFQSSVNLLLAVGFFTLASTGKVDLPSILGFSLAYAAYLYLGLKGRALLFEADRVSFFSKVYIAVFLLDMWWLSKSFVDAAIHLLIFIQILKFFSEKKDKDYFYLIGIAFMELLAAAAMTINASFFVAFLVFLTLVISTLTSFEIKRSQQSLSTSAPQQLKEGSNHSGAANMGTRRLYGALAAASATLSIGIVATAVFFFFALPRVGAGFFSRLNAPVQSLTGFSTSVQFGAVGSLKRNMTIVMRVQVEGDPRQFEGVKWRGIALNGFMGNSWRRTFQIDSGRLPRDAGGNYQVLPEQIPPPHRLVRYRVLLEPISSEVMFAAARARAIQTQAQVRVDKGDSFTTTYHPYSRIRYDVVSDIGSPPASTLRNTGTEYPPEFVQDYLDLPAVDTRISELAMKITRADTNSYDRARSVERYLRENFGYTLDLPAVQEQDPIAQFLFETRRGHCEYFATSMAILLRTLGIPSRVINGFQTGEYNAVGKDFIVRQADAHSWVEVFFPGYGWVAFDPTPAVAPPKQSAAWITLNHYLDALELFWINWIVGYDAFRQVTLFQGLQRRTLLFKNGMEQSWSAWTTAATNYLQKTFFSAQSFPGQPGFWAHREQEFLWGGGGLLALLGSWGLWRLVCRRRLVRSPHPHLVTETFSQWLRTLARHGFHRRPCQTPLEFSQSINDAQIRAAAIEIATLYNALRYDPSRLNAQTYLSFRTRLHFEISNL
ncbi:MAG: transglutaminaseTgpA domain-containing protein [Acidobacteriia bacterium]|nr:transglutaminaseTgpA domain-containing protein [Terriglobia bacterium]